MGLLELLERVPILRPTCVGPTHAASPDFFDLLSVGSSDGLGLGEGFRNLPAIALKVLIVVFIIVDAMVDGVLLVFLFHLAKVTVCYFSPLVCAWVIDPIGRVFFWVELGVSFFVGQIYIM